MKVMIVLALAVTLTGVACEKKKKKETYTYDFTVNGCATGRHSFDSVAALCEGLSDHARNKGCALSQRLEMAKSRNCPQVDNNNGPVFRTSTARGRPSPGSNVSFYVSYQINENGCDTGFQEFFSKRELCTGLVNEELNKGCAREDRLERFKTYGCE